MVIRDGGVIKDGYDSELDELRNISGNADASATVESASVAVEAAAEASALGGIIERATSASDGDHA